MAKEKENNFFLFINWEDKDQEPPRYSPYFLGGIGYYSFNPQALVGNKLIDLQPLSTEGQGLKEYPDKKVYKLKNKVLEKIIQIRLSHVII